MTETESKLARRISSSSASSYKTENFVASSADSSDSSDKVTGNLSVGECLRLAKKLEDVTLLPKSCRDYIEKQDQLKRAFEGMPGSQRDRAATAAGRLTHAQLQRRWTSRRDPLAHKKP